MKGVLTTLLGLALVGGAYYAYSSKFEISNDEPQVVEESPTTPTLNISPKSILQGDPVLVTVEGAGVTKIKSLTWQGAAVPIFIYNEKPAVLLGIDLKKTTGDYPVTLNLTDGSSIKKDLIVAKREAPPAPLGIPDKLGGNTPEAEQNLLQTLAKENAEIGAVRSTDEQLWSKPFRYPINNPVVTDHYGYTRLTGSSQISHKGTDFRAAVGTPVFAMNDGVVAVAKTFVEYGNTIIIDHGLGVLTLYMHLSKLEVKAGETVKNGQEIALSGDTGYAEFPHLHISVKIGGPSIDVEKFLSLFSSSD